MRIAIVSQMVPYLPCHDGFRVIPANLIRLLSQRHELHLIALSEGIESNEQMNWTQQYCRSVTTLPMPILRTFGGRLARLSNSLSASLVKTVEIAMRMYNPQLLHLEGPTLAPLARLTPAGGVSLLSAHDSLSLRYRQFAQFACSWKERLRYQIRAWKARRFERRWYGKVDWVVVTSVADAEALASSAPAKRLQTIPNGIDLEHWNYCPSPQNSRIVFTGNMNWPPNEDAAIYFATEAFPTIRTVLPQATFWIVGANPSPVVQTLANLPGVYVTGTVPDLREWIWSASVYVSPLRFGAGVKNKVLEAMALGAPIVATPTSLTGTPLVHERHLLVAEEAKTLATSVLRLLGDEGLRHLLSREARQIVEQEYSWELIAKRFESLYTQ